MSSYYRGGPSVTLQFPPVTPGVKVILWTLGVAYAAQFVLQKASFGIIPAWLALTPPALLEPPYPVWQLVTYGILHGGLWHLLMNMLGIWMFGGDVERVLGTRGIWRFFVVCVLGGGLLYAAVGLAAGAVTPVVGASAGVLGCVVAYAIFFPDRRVFIFPIPFPVTARVLAIIYGLITLYSAIESNPGDKTAHVAHLGGLIAGVIYVAIVRGGGGGGLFKRKKRYPYEVYPGGRPTSRYDIN